MGNKQQQGGQGGWNPNQTQKPGQPNLGTTPGQTQNRPNLDKNRPQGGTQGGRTDTQGGQGGRR